MAIAELLSRLRKVKPAGPGKWMACCPAHEDRSPSLSIRLTDDGRILLKCFTGCGAADVISAVGLEFVDLFPESTETRKPIAQPFSAADALRALSAESGVIAVAVADIVDGKAFTEADVERINLAAGRITTALEYVYGSR
jgi:hypothetical protein